jgi:5-methyltetrahydrofolate--homocysteine methyltransferase
VNPEKFAKIKAEVVEKRKKAAESLSEQKEKVVMSPELLAKRSDAVSVVETAPEPPDYKRHIVRNAPLEQIWKYVNPLMLYSRHLGIKAKSARLIGEIERDKQALKVLEAEDPSSFQIYQAVEAVKQEYKNKDVLKPTAVYQFFRAHSEGHKVFISDENDKTLATFEFSRQAQIPHLCLADYLNDKTQSPDNMAFFVVTAGKNVRAESTRLKDNGEFLKSHILQALAIETAEAYAEYLHSFVRGAWGFPDSPDMTMMDRFQAKYRGKRYSFGYPACPRLEDQASLFKLLQPEEIGVQLTDGFMMDPEASVSAIAFHHPDAKYYSVGNQLEEGL